MESYSKLNKSQKINPNEGSRNELKRDNKPLLNRLLVSYTQGSKG